MLSDIAQIVDKNSVAVKDISKLFIETGYIEIEIDEVDEKLQGSLKTLRSNILDLRNRREESL